MPGHSQLRPLAVGPPDRRDTSRELELVVFRANRSQVASGVASSDLLYIQLYDTPFHCLSFTVHSMSLTRQLSGAYFQYS
jgi:hypothetical protein